jgi:choline-sulfatase
MQVIEGKGDLLGLIRDELPVRGAASKMARMAGPGESPYTQYDREIASRAQIWLREEAPKCTGKPWVLFVSFVCPHYPLTAPPEHFYRYFDDPKLPMPLFYEEDERPKHPFVRDYAASFNFDIISRRRGMCAAPLRDISGSAASWTSRRVKCWAPLRRQGLPPRRA